MLLAVLMLPGYVEASIPGEKQLTSSGMDQSAVWSPDGKKVAFVSSRTGSRQIWVMNADGSSQAQVTNIAGNALNPAWSPDGNKIAFTARLDSASQDSVYVVNVDGSGLKLLTEPPVGFDSPPGTREPTWDPLADRVLFHNAAIGDGPAYIGSVPSSGGVPTSFFSNETPWAGPHFSPNGQLVMILAYDGSQQAYTVTRDGGNLTAIPKPSSDSTARFHTYGFYGNDRVGFSSNYENPSGGYSSVKIYYMNLDGTGLTTLSRSSSLEAEQDFSPDGKSLVFTKVDSIGDDAEFTNARIYRAPVTGFSPELVDPSQFKVKVKAAKRTKTKKLARKGRRGYNVTVTCTLDCSGTVTLKAKNSAASRRAGLRSGKKLVRKKFTGKASKGKRVNLKISGSIKRKLVRAGKVRAVLEVKASAPNKSATKTVRKKVTVTR